jgi:hypothetical protein
VTLQCWNYSSCAVKRFICASSTLEQLSFGDSHHTSLSHGVAFAVASLTRLTRLELNIVGWNVCADAEPKERALWCRVCGGLGGDRPTSAVPRTALLSANLAHLCVRLRGRQLGDLQECFTRMTRLTHLSLEVHVTSWGYFSSTRWANRAWRRLTCVQGLTRLRHLELGALLHDANVAGDVRCLARLTNLTYLRAWGLFPEPPGLRLRVFERLGGFLQLTCLEMLSMVTVSGCWDALRSPRFTEPFNGMRRALGRPPLIFLR